MKKIASTFFVLWISAGGAQGAVGSNLMPRELVGLAQTVGCQPYKDHYLHPTTHNPPYVYNVMPNDSLPIYSSAAFWCHKVKGGQDFMVLVIATFDLGYPPTGKEDFCHDGKFCYGVRTGKVLGMLEREGRGACGLESWGEPVPYNWLRRIDTQEPVDRPGELTRYPPIVGVAGDGICPAYYFEDGIWYTFTPD